MLTSSGDSALLESDRLRSNRVRSGLPPNKGDDDSVPSLSSHDTPLHNDDAFYDNDRMEDELPDVAHGVHTDSFENCFSVRMSASDYFIVLPEPLQRPIGSLYGSIHLNCIATMYGRTGYSKLSNHSR